MMANRLQNSGVEVAVATELHRRDSGDRLSIGKSGHGDHRSAEYSDRLNGSAERPLKFSIDNILRPEFGGGASGCSSPAAVFGYYKVRHNGHVHDNERHHHQEQQHPGHVDRLNRLDYLQLQHLHRLGHGAAAATTTAAVTSDPPDRSTGSSSRRSSASSATVEPLGSPIDLSCSDSQQTCGTVSATAVVAAAKEANVASADAATDKDDNGSKQWPAWVYCTRYSDRPSSGKSHL